ncbi:hypothetical protein Poli38472_010449 [Pythium oligandrum]|uniref:RWP-RK domain-containing protein n=1 Tax=Pythium oligandrum TaxID=41045 RepID=A0A8K1C340_PYTOL|nr:hypothetical protein Poli38472_010449 [Pythium oligandrum]|eukprot:TMW55567.1 hypothetical protein Poli38472_010449 [Pythium oligandrum]
MGVQPRRPLTEQVNKSPSMVPVASPMSRKRRFMDVVLLQEATATASAPLLQEEDELAQRVTFKRSKTDVEVVYSPTPMVMPALPVSPISSPSTKAARPNMSASQTITLEMLRPHFEKPLAQVAQSFGICVTLLKKICRKNGLARWPHRQIIGLRKSIASMEQAIDHFEGSRRDLYAQQLDKQRNKLTALLEDPTKCSSLTVDEEAAPSSPVEPYSGAQFHQNQYYMSYTAPAAKYTHSYQAYSPQAFAPQPALYTRGQEYYQPHSYPPSPVSPPTHQVASPSVQLPPLRQEFRQVLPSLASVVNRRW